MRRGDGEGANPPSDAGAAGNLPSVAGCACWFYATCCGAKFSAAEDDMKCEEIAELLPDYLQDGLQEEHKKIVEEACIDSRRAAESDGAGAIRCDAAGLPGGTRKGSVDAPRRYGSVDLERVPVATFSGGRGGVEHRAGGAGNVSGTATWQCEIELAGISRDAYGSDKHAADGCALDAAATVGEPAVGGRDVDAEGRASRSAGAFGVDAHAAV